jgi:hypothetical protein
MARVGSADIERRYGMQEMNIKPQSWDVVDDQEDGHVAEFGETDAVAYSFSYARV